jgi:hypothetical protein
VPHCPEGAGPAGRRLWRDVVHAWDLGEADLLLLRQAVDVADRVDRLAGLARKTTPVIQGRLGQLVPSPLAVELRAERRLLVQLLAALGLTTDAVTAPVVPQLPARHLAVVRGRAG